MAPRSQIVISLKREYSSETMEITSLLLQVSKLLLFIFCQNLFLLMMLLRGEVLAADAFIALNSSMWVIGPFYHLRKDHSLIRSYYCIAAAVTYCMTSEGTFIIYIRSLSTEDKSISCKPWDITFCLSCQADNYPATEKDKSINSGSFGVLLMCALQTLHGNEKLSIDLHLQIDFLNKFFMWFIMIGFWYS